MKIRHLTFSTHGGAGRVASSLAEAQTALGVSSEVVALSESDLRHEPFARPSLTARAALDKYLVIDPARATFFSYFRDRYRGADFANLDEVDILNLHWMNGVLSPYDIAQLVRERRAGSVMWTLHDMAPFTGGCHYALDCMRFESDCSGCPQVRRVFRKGVASRFQERTSLSSDLARIGFVAPSPWIREMALKSRMLHEARIDIILNPIDPVFFESSSRTQGRAELEIKPGELVGLLVAADLTDPRKEVEKTLNSVARVLARGSKVRLLVAGNHGEKLLEKYPFITYLGSCSAADLARFGPAADFLIVMSSADTAPLVIGEAAAMGVPTFVRTGTGASQLVTDGVDGVRVEGFDDLERAIEKAQSHRDWLAQLGIAAANHARTHHEPGAVARAYLNLYSQHSEDAHG